MRILFRCSACRHRIVSVLDEPCLHCIRASNFTLADKEVLTNRLTGRNVPRGVSSTIQEALNEMEREVTKQ